MATIGLYVAFDEELGFWYFVVERVYEPHDTPLGVPGTEVLHFRPGFRSEAQAILNGEYWIVNNLNVKPPDGE